MPLKDIDDVTMPTVDRFFLDMIDPTAFGGPVQGPNYVYVGLENKVFEGTTFAASGGAGASYEPCTPRRLSAEAHEHGDG